MPRLDDPAQILERRAMHDPRVPETLEGWSVLHQMFRIRWETWKGLPPVRRREVAESAASLLGSMEGRQEGPSALVSLLGHKGDLMLIHFRRSFDELSRAELQVAQSGLHDHLQPSSSYVSLVELGLYDMTGKIHEDLSARGLKVGTSDFDRAFDDEVGHQRERVMSRLYTEI